jgi:hypothetical protein
MITSHNVRSRAVDAGVGDVDIESGSFPVTNDDPAIAEVDTAQTLAEPPSELPTSLGQIGSVDDEKEEGSSEATSALQTSAEGQDTVGIVQQELKAVVEEGRTTQLRQRASLQQWHRAAAKVGKNLRARKRYDVRGNRARHTPAVDHLDNRRAWRTSARKSKGGGSRYSGPSANRYGHFSSRVGGGENRYGNQYA